MEIKSRSVRNRLSSYLWEMAPERLKNWNKQIETIKFRYRTRMNRELNLLNPSRFSEKMQWRKLFEASDLFTQLSDKIAVRDYIAGKDFSSMLIPQLWSGTDPNSIPFDDLPRPFIIKSSHGCGHTIIVSQEQIIDRDQIIAQAQGWLAYCHGTAFLEPGYLDVPHRLVVEPLLVCSDGHPPAELKVFVFDGTARYAQYVAMRQDRNQPFAFVDRNWTRYPWCGQYPPLNLPEKPLQFDVALAVAGKLCAKIDHCRVDFYLKDDQIYIGEMTLYSYTGMILLNPQETDAIMGSFWRVKWPKTRAILAIIMRNWGRK